MTGMATSEGELIDGSTSMAAPLFREDGIVGAIGARRSGLPLRRSVAAAAGRLLQEAAREVNAALAEDESR